MNAPIHGNKQIKNDVPTNLSRWVEDSLEHWREQTYSRVLHLFWGEEELWQLSLYYLFLDILQPESICHLLLWFEKTKKYGFRNKPSWQQWSRWTGRIQREGRQPGEENPAGIQLCDSGKVWGKPHRDRWGWRTKAEVRRCWEGRIQMTR